MINPRRATALTVSLVLVCLSLAVPARAASPTPPSSQASAQLDRLLEPLRAAAKSLSAVGRGKYAATYSGLALNPEDRKVDLYVTDLARLPGLLAEADKAGTYNHNLVRAHKAPYSKRALHTARERLMAKGESLGAHITSVAIPSQATGLKVGASDKNMASSARTLGVTAGVPVTVSYQASGQDASRYDSAAPFFAGAFITTSIGSCTSGLPVHDGFGRSYLVTAGHCGHIGVTFKTGGGRPVGKVILFEQEWDASLIDARSKQKEWDGPPSTTRTFDVHGSEYSHNGDAICQDGIVSGIVCGIRVTDDDIRVKHCGNTYGCSWSRGVVGHTSSGTAMRHGDSGALVFCYCAGRRPARGIASTLSDKDSTYIFWTESPDILKAFGVSMY